MSLNNKHKKSEKGASTLAYVMGLSMMGLAAIQGMQYQVNNTSVGQKAAAEDMLLQNANATALEQVSHIVGTTLVMVDASKKLFVPTSQLPAATRTKMFSGNTFSSLSGGERTWFLNLDTGRLNVDLCMKPTVDPKKFYANNDAGNVNWTGAFSSCPEEFKSRTEVRATQFIPVSQMEGETRDAFLVDTFTYTLKDPSKKYEKKARITYLPPTQKCDVNSESSINDARCGVDHCKFMAPRMDNSKQVKYVEQNGTLGMSYDPNPNYVEKMHINLNSNIPMYNANYNSFQRMAADDGVDLRTFITTSLSSGANNPFDKRQGVGPRVVAKSYLTRNADGSVTFDFKALQSKGDVIDTADSSDLMRFLGYMYINSTFTDSLLMDWQDPTPANLMRMKQACTLSVGAPLADFCSKILIKFARYGYEYDKLKRCTYKGPSRTSYPDIPLETSDVVGYIQKGGKNMTSIRDWAESENDMSVGSWEDSTEKTAGIKVISATGGQFTEPVQDFHITSNTVLGNPDKSFGQVVDMAIADVANTLGYRSYHGFANVFDGQVSLVQIKSKTNAEIAASIAAMKEADGDSPKTDAEYLDLVPKFFERKINLNFEPNCSYEELNVQTSHENNVYHDFDQCFYITYNNSNSRLGCFIDNPNLYVCRNASGCFTSDAPILMADGTYREIKDIQIGDYLLNPNDGSPLRVERLVRGPEEKSLYKIHYFYNGEMTSLTITHNHPFVTDKGMMLTENLTTKDKLLTDKYGYVAIANIEILPESTTTVFNLELMDKAGKSMYLSHLLVANGVVSGDYVIQKNYKNLPKDEMSEFTQFLLEKDLSK